VAVHLASVWLLARFPLPLLAVVALAVGPDTGVTATALVLALSRLTLTHITEAEASTKYSETPVLREPLDGIPP
jgi:hypothetical protein